MSDLADNLPPDLERSLMDRGFKLHQAFRPSGGRVLVEADTIEGCVTGINDAIIRATDSGMSMTFGIPHLAGSRWFSMGLAQ